MKAICVDDEPLAVEYTLGQCAFLPEIDEAKGFTDARSGMDWLREHETDLAILDINMPGIDGITLAARMKELCPRTAILFLTAYMEYAYDAYSVHPTGYLLKPVSLEKNVLTLATSDELQRQWVEDRYLTKLEEAVFNLSGEHLSIELKTMRRRTRIKPENEVQMTLAINDEKISPVPAPKISAAPVENVTLNHRYTFENFVIGKSNEFAHAAALAICKEPGVTYNPFFIYGGVGLGKTHLMHAIGNRISQNMPTKKILYVSGEQFTTELITALREHKINAFKEKYRKVDVLLVDDVQFLAGKDATQEEFFHTFNELHNLDKQIVIAADKPPKEIEGIEERLSSRFSWGLCTDIQKPDIETRIAILQKKAELEKILIPPKIIADLAEKFDSNVRDLEGAFTRVIARASLMNKTFESAFSDLEEDDSRNLQAKVIVSQEKTPPRSDLSLQQIVATVANYFSLEYESLLSNSRAQRIARPKHITMFLCRELTSSSWAVIAKFFGKRDHATVIRAYNKIKRELKKNPHLLDTVEKLFPILKS